MNENRVNSARTQARPQTGAPKLDLKQLWMLAVVNWHWFVVSVVLCCLLGFVYLWITPTTVSVMGKMEIIDKSKKGSGLSAGMAMLNSLPMGLGSALGGSLGGSAGIDAEKEILMSNSLVTNVVKELGLYTEYRLSSWGRNRLLYQDQPINVSLDPAHVEWLDSELPLYFHQIKLTITKDSKGYTVKTMLRENREKTYLPEQTFASLPATFKTDAGVITITENTVLTPRQSKVYEGGYKLKVDINPPMETADALISTLKIDPPSKKVTNIVNITFSGENVMRGIDFVNHLVEAYNQRANDDKNEEARKTDEFVNARLALVDKELGSSDSELENFKKQSQITMPQVDAQEVMTKKSLYETQLVEIGTQLQIHDYLSDYINDPANLFEIIPLSIGTNGVNAGGDNSAVATQSASLIAQHNSMVNHRRELLKSVSEKAPLVERLTESINELHPVIKTAMKRDRQSIIMKRNNVEREYGRYMGRVGSAPQQERVLTEIGRQREIKQGVYLVMLQKREETAMELANVTDKGRLIDPTRMVRNSSKPQKKMTLVSVFVLSLLFPMFILFVQQLLKTKIGNRVDLESLTKASVIGEIPLSNQDEAIRAMRSNLMQKLHAEHQAVMFISEADGDGKTYLAEQLADSLTAIGKKAFYFNADLRGANKPSTDKHPVDIMASADFARQMEKAKADNDFVIIDTPALSSYNDANLIATYADATVFVVKADHTRKTVIDKLKKKSFPQLMYVLNAIDMGKKKNKYLYK